MRIPLCAALLSLSAPAVFAQAQAPAPVLSEALLMKDDNTFQTIWIIEANATSIRFLHSKVDTEAEVMRISAARSIYLLEPQAFTLAMDKFQGRKYEEAKTSFAALKALYKPMAGMPGNFSTLSAFYEMESMRKLGDLDGLAQAMGKFLPGPLQRDWQKRQVELYAMWDAVRTKGWSRIESMAKEQSATPLPGNLRAQVGYCLGLALEGLNRPAEALNSYNTALTADSGASEEVARSAALNILRVLKADPRVTKAIDRWGAPDEVKTAQGRTLLLEASAMAHMYQSYFAQGVPLPQEYQSLLTYKDQVDKAAGKTEAAGEKPETTKEPEGGKGGAAVEGADS